MSKTMEETMGNNGRIERLRLEYVNSKPSVCHERAKIWTESHKKTEGEELIVRRSKAFLATCEEIPINIFEDELVVGTPGNFKRGGIFTPEFSWKTYDSEIDSYSERPQDPYYITAEQRDILRNEIFPYWKNKSLEEYYLKQIPEDTAKILIDKGILDIDFKFRNAVGELTPDYQDILFVKGYKKIKEEAQERLNNIEANTVENLEKINFYKSQVFAAEGIMRLAERYAEKAEELAAKEIDPLRSQDLLVIAKNCRNVPANPPKSLYEAIQFLWFVQVCNIISENAPSFNLGRFDQYMYPYYKKDIDSGLLTQAQAQEIIEALWIKLSEWVWIISSNSAQYYAGYNQFQNLTIGGRKKDGTDGTNDLSYMCLKATANVKTHQPSLSVRIHHDCPEEFMMAVVELISKGIGFPAVHSDYIAYQMLQQAGVTDPEDAMDWNNLGCVVPNTRKAQQWTLSTNVSFGGAFELALNQGKRRLTGEQLGVNEKPASEFENFEEVREAFFKQLTHLIKHSVIGTIVAQKLHAEIVPRPFQSTYIEGCMEKGKDLSKGGAKYNLGPGLSGYGLAVVANGLFAIKKLVFDDEVTTLEEISRALEADWIGYEELRNKALDVPKYGNDNDNVDLLAVEISNFWYKETRKHKDIFGAPFNSAFMGVSSYIPLGKHVGALPCGRKAKAPLTEGMSPFIGTDITSPLATMRSVAKLNHEMQTSGTLLNLRLNQELVKTNRGRRNIASIIRAFFTLGGAHVQFNTVSNETLRAAQENPDEYRDLLVRVAGYSTQFIHLSREMQEAIIARNVHENV